MSFRYFRRIENLPPAAADFLDLDADGAPDREAAPRLERVKAMLRLKLGANVQPIEPPGPRPASRKIICSRFATTSTPISRARSFAACHGARLDALAAEIAAHTRFGAERAQGFLGRPEELAAIVKYAADATAAGRPLLIVGDAGSGKSSLMAQAARRIAETSPQTLVVQRFLGATAASADPALSLRGLCHEIYRRCDLEQVKLRRLEATSDDYQRGLIEAEFAIAGDVALLGNKFRSFLCMFPAGRRMVIFLDALDQLVAVPGSEAMTWLPAQLPDAARLVVSFAAGARTAAFRSLLGSADTLDSAPWGSRNPTRCSTAGSPPPAAGCSPRNGWR